MGKYLRVTMPDGSKWDVPVHIIADSRAKYYAELDSKREGKNFDSVYKDEYEYTLNNNGELLDWSSNNMNWSDVESKAVKVFDTIVNFQDGWINGDKEIIEIEKGGKRED